MIVYAQVSDILAVGVSLTAAESETAEVLIEQACAKLRTAARRYGKDIDTMITDEKTGEDYALTVKNVIVQAVVRALNSASDTSPAVSQTSQSGLGYSASYTYLNAGQSLYFLKSELKDLRLLRQTWGFTEVYKNADDTGN